MATYLELFDLQNNDDLLRKATTAIAVAADTIRSEATGTANHANRLVWAEKALANPKALTDQVLWAVLAANNGSTVDNITGATDSAIQTNVDAAVDVLAGVA